MEALVAHLRRQGVVQTEEVARALLAVDRARYCPARASENGDRNNSKLGSRVVIFVGQIWKKWSKFWNILLTIIYGDWMKFLENSFTPGNFLEFSAVPAKNLSTFRRKIIDLEEIQKKVRLLKSRKIPRSCKIVQHLHILSLERCTSLQIL